MKADRDSVPRVGGRYLEAGFGQVDISNLSAGFADSFYLLKGDEAIPAFIAC